MSEGKYIKFKLADKQNPKTQVWWVLSKDLIQEYLGEIKWLARWRQYSFFPAKDTVFEKTCLSDIIDFMVALMDKRKREPSQRSNLRRG